MFSISDHQLDRNCQGFSRRDFLRVGALGLGGLGLGTLGLNDILSIKAQAEASGIPTTGKSVVLLFLSGGAPHIEFFDPKMTAPVEYRSITGEIKTKTPGMTLGGTFPKLAKISDKFSIVRSFGSKNGGHTYESVTTARNSMKASMGSIFSRVAGPLNPSTGIPNNALILPEAVSPGLKLKGNFETQALHTLTPSGSLGPSAKAFDLSGSSTLKQDMELKIDPKRLTDRKSLLTSLDKLKGKVDSNGGLESVDRFRQQAFNIISSGISKAFDLSKESKATLERYDTRPLFDDKKLQKWGDLRRATNLLGVQMLLARRLCEAGCGFVTVSDCGWDYHANGNSPKNMTALYPMGYQVDHAVSAFIEDIHERGLSEKVLLVVTSEMGRTPKINRNGGRDHYGELTSLLVAGGGLKMGQCIGKSDVHAARPSSFAYKPEHLMATIFNTIFDLGELRVTDGLPSKLIEVATKHEPIVELM